jgi:mitosis inhibitor protein kinase SWE1
VLTDDNDPGLGSRNGGHLNIISRVSSISTSSIYSDGDEGLITPVVGPANSSSWPVVDIVGLHANETGDHGFNGNEGGVDAFILRTLAAAATCKQEGMEWVPGTPVKKVKMSYLGERPLQSAVANKIGFGFEFEKERKIPRKSLPSMFPATRKNVGSHIDLSWTDSEGDEVGGRVIGMVGWDWVHCRCRREGECSC